MPTSIGNKKIPNAPEGSRSPWAELHARADEEPRGDRRARRLAVIRHARPPRKSAFETRSPRRAAKLRTGIWLSLSIAWITAQTMSSAPGWASLAFASVSVGLFLLVRRRFARISERGQDSGPALYPVPGPAEVRGKEEIDPSEPVAVIWVSADRGLGIGTLSSVRKLYPGFYRDFLFVSVGTLDRRIKGAGELEALRRRMEKNLRDYAEYARSLGLNAGHRCAVGFDLLGQAEAVCKQISDEYPKATFYLGKAAAQDEWACPRSAQERTVYAIQRRLELNGIHAAVLSLATEVG